MNTRKYSKAQEKRIAKNTGGRLQPNSGATPFMKGDIITEDFLIECKTKTKESASMSIKKEWLEDIQFESFAMGRSNWALGFNFGGLNNPENFYIIDERLFIQLKDKLEEEF